MFLVKRQRGSSVYISVFNKRFFKTLQSEKKEKEKESDHADYIYLHNSH